MILLLKVKEMQFRVIKVRMHLRSEYFLFSIIRVNIFDGIRTHISSISDRDRTIQPRRAYSKHGKSFIT